MKWTWWWLVLVAGIAVLIGQHMKIERQEEVIRNAQHTVAAQQRLLAIEAMRCGH
jgi:hypothetical protein